MKMAFVYQKEGRETLTDGCVMINKRTSRPFAPALLQLEIRVISVLRVFVCDLQTHLRTRTLNYEIQFFLNF